MRDEDGAGYDIANAASSKGTAQEDVIGFAVVRKLKQAIEARRRPTSKINKVIANAKTSVAARPQFKPGHAITGVHLVRIGKVEDAQCWWCGRSGQTVAHLLLCCRKWRRQRDSLLRGMRADEVVISARRIRQIWRACSETSPPEQSSISSATQTWAGQ